MSSARGRTSEEASAACHQDGDSPTSHVAPRSEGLSVRTSSCPHRELSTKPREKGDWASSALGVDKFHKSGAHKPARWGGENASSQETGVTVAEASIGAGKEFPEGKPYRVDKGLNAARKRARDTMALLNNKTQKSTYPVGIP